ncbi:Hypothetical predicted protein [Podarcis lilfordi]|uniref:Uncharacterized protein n=1 Tax=Podarcis lilfordi TaxID=74358 RepID=A0AA35LLI8_9SAUR|nr:Hypothetical predicted protein [Podarcis lilfordi]
MEGATGLSRPPPSPPESRASSGALSAPAEAGGGRRREEERAEQLSAGRPGSGYGVGWRVAGAAAQPPPEFAQDRGIVSRVLPSRKPVCASGLPSIVVDRRRGTLGGSECGAALGGPDPAACLAACLTALRGAMSFQGLVQKKNKENRLPPTSADAPPAPEQAASQGHRVQWAQLGGDRASISGWRASEQCDTPTSFDPAAKLQRRSAALQPQHPFPPEKAPALRVPPYQQKREG